jgi:CBS domain-containing protein
MSATASIRDAAKEMKDNSIGVVVVEAGGKVCGIVTDRDIVVRCVAANEDIDSTMLGSICSQDLVTLSPRDSVDKAIQLMKEEAIRRIPVVDNGKAVGIVSLGDLAQARDPKSVLGGISAAAPNV